MTDSREKLVRAIGTFGLAAGFINITIGGGIFRLPANVASTMGPSAWIAYDVCAVAMGLIVLCIAAARTAAMAFNRLVDREIDARNPRTQDRELPRGVLSVVQPS